MNIHVFVVNQITFKQHLEYMFAGTGAKNRMSLFLEKSDIKFQPTTERNLVGMIADISRVRPDDKIIFYLQATVNNPGMFFGIFKAKSAAFFDENDNKNYLSDELGKGLSYRIEIEAISHFMQFHRDGVSLAIRHIRNETAPRNHNGKWLARLPVVKHSRQMASIGMVLHGFLRVQAGHQFGLSLLHKARQIIERIQRGVGLFRTALCLHEILVLCRGNGF